MSVRWRPALVALDADGTLIPYELYDQPVPSPVVAKAVRQAHDSGACVVLATGRSMRAALTVLDHLDLTTGYAVCSNGAVVLDVATREPAHMITFDVADSVRYFAEQIPDAVLAVEELGRGYRVTGEFPAGDLDGEVTIVDHDDLIARPVTRLIVRWPDGDRERLHAIAAASGLSSVDYAIGYSAWLDIMPEGVSKASGLQRVAELVGVAPTDAMAVGDGHNDVEMLRWARLGVAMGQAPDGVKAMADDVCGDVDDDGVATLLNSFFADSDEPRHPHGHETTGP